MMKKLIRLICLGAGLADIAVQHAKLKLPSNTGLKNSTGVDVQSTEKYKALVDDYKKSLEVHNFVLMSIIKLLLGGSDKKTAMIYVVDGNYRDKAIILSSIKSMVNFLNKNGVDAVNDLVFEENMVYLKGKKHTHYFKVCSKLQVLGADVDDQIINLKE